MNKLTFRFLIFALIGFSTILIYKKIDSYSLKKNHIAAVNNVAISTKDYQQKLDQSKKFFSYSNQKGNTLASLEKDTLEAMINNQLIQAYAQKNNITAADEEIQKRYLSVIDGFNAHNNIPSGEEAFLQKINQMYGTTKTDYLIQIKNEILGEKIQTKVKIPLAEWLIEQKSKAEINRYL